MEEEGDLGAKLVGGIATGRPVVLGSEEEPAEIEADLLADVLFAVDVPHARGLHLRHAHIVGHLDLDDLRFASTLHFEACTFAGSVSLKRAALNFLAFTTCRLGSEEGAVGLNLSELKLASSLVITGTVVVGAINLNLARVDGMVDLLAGSKIQGNTEIRGNRYSLQADDLITGSGFFIEGATLHGAVNLNGATIGGQFNVRDGAEIGATTDGYSLNCNHFTTRSSIFIEGANTTLRGAVNFNSATIGGQLIVKSGATIGTTADGYSLEGDGLVTRDSIFIQGADTTLHGAVRLLDARIGGQLIVLGGATIGVTSSKYSLDADRLITTGGISIEGAGTMLHGAANVSSANIGGQLAICRGATIGAAIDCYSLRGDRLVATSGVFVDDTNTTLHGAASLNGASISGQFHVARATLGVADGWSVSADSATIDQILVTGAAMSGGINLRHASISQLLTINGATHLNSDGYPTSISMESARVARARLNSSASPGLVDLSGSHLQVLEDNPEFWGFGSQHRCIWRLAGLTVERLAVEPTFTAEQRREWLNLAAGPEGHGPADSGTYRMVARAQVSGGADDDAVDTLRAMRRAHDPPWLKRIHWPIGQGYKPHWALWLLLATLLATFGLTWIGDRNGTFVAVEELSPGDARQEHPLLSSRDCQKEHYPCLRPIVYAVDTIVPGLDLGEAGRWQPATTRQQPGRTDVLRWALVVLRLAGWAFGALFVIGMLNVVVEQRRTK